MQIIVPQGEHFSTFISKIKTIYTGNFYCVIVLYISQSHFFFCHISLLKPLFRIQ